MPLRVVAQVPIAFTVDRACEVSASESGVDGFILSERPIEAPYTKDYDSIPEKVPLNGHAALICRVGGSSGRVHRRHSTSDPTSTVVAWAEIHREDLLRDCELFAIRPASAED